MTTHEEWPLEPTGADYQIRALRGRITLLTKQCKTTADHWRCECAKRDAVIAELRDMLNRWVAKSD